MREKSPPAYLWRSGGPTKRRRDWQIDTNRLLILVFEMSRAITISYDLKPPANTPQSSLTPSKTQTFSVKDGESYYVGLRASIATAKETVGKELTEWRDQVGDLERGKDAKPQKTQADVDDDEEEEEEGK
jgi:hypothetical protein